MVVSIDGRQLCVDSDTGDVTCSQSQLVMTLAVLTSQLVGTGLAVVHPIVSTNVAGWVSAASHLLMTLSIAATLALTAQASTLALLRRQLSDQHTDDIFALYILMTIVSMTMWLSLWLFQGWVSLQYSAATAEEKRTKY
jgi:uncharacterized membrane protein YhaH (DUF805 family)